MVRPHYHHFPLHLYHDNQIELAIVEASLKLNDCVATMTAPVGEQLAGLDLARNYSVSSALFFAYGPSYSSAGDSNTDPYGA